MSMNVGILEYTVSLAGGGAFVSTFKSMMSQATGGIDTIKALSATLKELDKTTSATHERAMKIAKASKAAHALDRQDYKDAKADIDRLTKSLDNLGKAKEKVSGALKVLQTKHTDTEIDNNPALAKERARQMDALAGNRKQTLSKTAQLESANKLEAFSVAKTSASGDESKKDSRDSNISGIVSGLASVGAKLDPVSKAVVAAVAVLGALALGMKLAGDATDKLAPSFSATERGAVSMNKTLAGTHRATRLARVSIAEAGDILEVYARKVRDSEISTDLFAKTSGKLARQLKVNKGEAANLIADAMAGDMSGLLTKLGKNLDAVKADAKNFGMELNVDSAKSWAKYIDRSTAGGETRDRGTLPSLMSRGWRAVASRVGEANENLKHGGNGDQESVSTQVTEQSNLIEAQVSAIHKQKIAVGQLRAVWAGVVKTQHDLVAQMDKAQARIDAAKVGGTTMDVISQNIGHSYEKATALERGIDGDEGSADPASALVAFRKSASGVTDIMKALKTNWQTRRGQDELGTQVSGAQGDTAELASRNKSEYMLKEAKEAVADVLHGTTDHKDRVTLRGIQKDLNNSDVTSPESYEGALGALAEFFESKASEQSEELGGRAGETQKSAEAKSRDIFKQLDSSVESLRSLLAEELPETVSTMLEGMSQYNLALTSIHEGLNFLGVDISELDTKLKNFKPGEHGTGGVEETPEEGNGLMGGIVGGLRTAATVSTLGATGVVIEAVRLLRRIADNSETPTLDGDSLKESS